MTSKERMNKNLNTLWNIVNEHFTKITAIIAGLATLTSFLFKSYQYVLTSISLRKYNLPSEIISKCISNSFFNGIIFEIITFAISIIVSIIFFYSIINYKFEEKKKIKVKDIFPAWHIFVIGFMMAFINIPLCLYSMCEHINIAIIFMYFFGIIQAVFGRLIAVKIFFYLNKSFEHVEVSKTIKQAFLNIFSFTIAFAVALPIASIINTSTQKTYNIIEENATTYAVVATCDSYFVTERCTIENSKLIIDTNRQRIFGVGEKEYTKQNFERVELEGNK